MSLHSVKKEAMSLSPLEKVKLLDSIIESLNKPNPDIEKFWVEESEKRYKAYKAGKIKAIPAEEVFKKYEL